MGQFEEIANKMVVYNFKTSWLMLEKYYNVIALKDDVPLSYAFVLLAINKERGTLVTSIAPRIGMEPNSLSRILKKLVEKRYVVKRNSEKDKRKVFICLTSVGLKNQNIALKKLHSLEKDIKSLVSKEQLNGFFAVNEAIKKTMDKN